jgi:hypothetical protein
MYFDNFGAVSQFEEPRNHKKGKHIEKEVSLNLEIHSKMRDTDRSNFLGEKSNVLIYQAFCKEDVSSTLRYLRGRHIWVPLVFIV